MGLTSERPGNFKPNNYEARRWYKLAANRQSAEAQYWLGKIAEYFGDPNDPKTEALDWYEKSANLGYLESQIRLGELYSERDIDRSINWYERAYLNDGDELTLLELSHLKQAKKLGIYVTPSDTADLRFFKRRAIDSISGYRENEKEERFYDLSRVYRYGRYGAKKDAALADRLEKFSKE